jgi:hypothetical protein
MVRRLFEVGSCVFVMGAVGCGTSDQDKVERAIILRQPDRVIHSATCRATSKRAWRCELRTDPPGDVDRGLVTEVCEVHVGSDAGEIEHFLCTD